MTGLLKKDFFVMRKQMGLYLLLIVVFSLIPAYGQFGNIYAMMMAFLLPMSTISYDERCKWDKYAAMLPYNMKQIVLSKYVLGYLTVAAAVAIALLCNFLQGILGMSETGFTGESVLATVGMAAIPLIFNAYLFPITYRFGAEKGRLLAMLPLFIVAGAGTFLVMRTDTARVVGALEKMSPVLLVVDAVILLAVLQYISFRLSLRFYRNRRNRRYN